MCAQRSAQMRTAFLGLNGNIYLLWQGDSGGPLRYKDMLVGLVSYGEGCGKKGYPGVYSDVASMRSYVDSVIKSNA